MYYIVQVWGDNCQNYHIILRNKYKTICQRSSSVTPSENDRLGGSDKVIWDYIRNIPYSEIKKYCGLCLGEIVRKIAHTKGE